MIITAYQKAFVNKKQEKILSRMNEIEQEIKELKNLIDEIYQEQIDLSDYYIENMNASGRKIGALQRKLDNMSDKSYRKIEKLENELLKLKTKYHAKEVSSKNTTNEMYYQEENELDR